VIPVLGTLGRVGGKVVITEPKTDRAAGHTDRPTIPEDQRGHPLTAQRQLRRKAAAHTADAIENAIQSASFGRDAAAEI
jgi:hypothetical protein